MKYWVVERLIENEILGLSRRTL